MSHESDEKEKRTQLHLIKKEEIFLKYSFFYYIDV